MKQILILTYIAISSLVNSPLPAQQNAFIEDYLERLENSRKYLILVAETMPEDKYNFKATPESKSFSENLMHIGYALDRHSQSLLGLRDSRDWKTDTTFVPINKSKKEMIATIDKAFDETISLIERFDPAKLDDELDYFGLKRSK